jgi:hypothetical protein
MQKYYGYRSASSMMSAVSRSSSPARPEPPAEGVVTER